MLSQQELEEYFSKHTLSAAAREFILFTRDKPSREVGINAMSNVVSGFMSSKTKQSIQTESRTAEHAYAIRLEYSRTVLEFWDQPPPIPVVRTSSKNKSLPGTYTPDFVVLDSAKPEVVEVKTAEEIRRLIEEKPADWMKTESGVIFRPGLEACAKLGLAYKVVSSASLNPIETENLKLLLQARSIPSLVTNDISDAVTRSLSEQAWIRLSELGERIGVVDLTPLVQMIELGVLHALLTEELLTQPDSAWIASSPEHLALCKQSNPARTGYISLGNDHSSVLLVRVPSGKQLSRGLKNLDRINSGEKSKSVRRWNRTIQKKSTEGLDPIHAVSPQWQCCGNRTERLTPKQLEILNNFITKHYADSMRLSLCTAHKLYKNIAQELHPHLPAVSRPTLKRYISLQNTKEIARGRGGRRAANAATEPSAIEIRQLRATRPFQLGTMDHYETDIHCSVVHRNGTHYTARPYLSLLIDVENDYVYSVWMSFRSPSRRSCAMVIRLCVRQHGRLPEEIIVDGGADFESVYFFGLLAHCKVGKVRRPPEHPRYGSQAERFFLEFKTQWLALRQGNLVNYDEARAVSSTHAPSNQAVITIEQLYIELLAFCDWRNSNNVNTTNLSPAERLAQGLQRFSCSGRKVSYDQEFVVVSAVDVKSFSLDPVRGIHIGEFHYWNPALRQLVIKGRVEAVREEPEDPYRVYAKVGGEWVTCLTTGEQQFLVKDPVKRIAEAIRIHDGRNLRLEAKADADQLLITKMRQLDAQWATDAATHLEARNTIKAQTKAQSIFDEIRGKEITPLKHTKWET